jgi:hypothetical protein
MGMATKTELVENLHAIFWQFRQLEINHVMAAISIEPLGQKYPI